MVATAKMQRVTEVLMAMLTQVLRMVACLPWTMMLMVLVLGMQAVSSKSRGHVDCRRRAGRVMLSAPPAAATWEELVRVLVVAGACS